MTHVVLVEGCAAEFPTSGAFQNWLDANGYGDVKLVKGYALRSNLNGKWLTDEKKRSVWQYNIGVAKVRDLKIERPNRFVVIGTTKEPRWTAEDYPPLLQSTIEHNAEKERKHKERVAKARAERAAKELMAPPKPQKAKRQRTSVKDKKPSPKRGRKPSKKDALDDAQGGLNIDA